MSRRPNRVRLVQVGPDGSLLNYHGPSEKEAAIRLFDASKRPLSAVAERLLKSLANDKGQTQRTSASSRSTSGWWNGQPVEEETRNDVFSGPNITTSTPQKQPDQATSVPRRPSKVTTTVFNEEDSTNTNSQLMVQGS